MSIEQRLAVIESEIAELKGQQSDKKSLSKLVQKITSETIKNSLRPGGLLHRSEHTKKAAENKATVLTDKTTVLTNAQGIIVNAQALTLSPYFHTSL